MIFCVLTCDTLEQAIDRAGLKAETKATRRDSGAVEMAQSCRKRSQASLPRPGAVQGAVANAGGAAR